jgi:hypothetical protein
MHIYMNINSCGWMIIIYLHWEFNKVETNA